MPTKRQSINPALIPPLPDLQLAVVGMRDGRMDEMRRRLGNLTTDKLRKLGKIYLTLSQKNCFACGAKSDPSIKQALSKKSVPWEELKLCSCLAGLRDGYREYYPWQKEFANLQQGMPALEILKSKDLDGRTLMYTDACSRAGCGAQFRVTALMIANAIEKYGQHRQMHRCKKCIQEARQTAQLKSNPSGEGGSHAAVPSRKRSTTRERPFKVGEVARVTHNANDPQRVAQHNENGEMFIPIKRAEAV